MLPVDIVARLPDVTSTLLFSDPNALLFVDLILPIDIIATFPIASLLCLYIGSASVCIPIPIPEAYSLINT